MCSVGIPPLEYVNQTVAAAPKNLTVIVLAVTIILKASAPAAITARASEPAATIILMANAPGGTTILTANAPAAITIVLAA